MLMRRTLPILILALSGCFGGSDEGFLVRQIDVPQGLSRYRSVTVEVSTRNPEWYDGVEPLKTSVLTQLAIRRCFDTFIREGEPIPADLRIVVVVTDAGGVSDAERTLLGGLAGKPRVTADVRLIDTRSGRMAGHFEVEGTTSGGSPTGHTSPEAYENAGTGIADYIQLHQ